jgi:hypothetical protein
MNRPAHGEELFDCPRKLASQKGLFPEVVNELVGWLEIYWYSKCGTESAY